MSLLQYELVSNGHSPDVVRAVRFQRFLDEIALSCVWRGIIWDRVVPKEDLHGHLCLFDSFELCAALGASSTCQIYESHVQRARTDYNRHHKGAHGLSTAT